MEQFQTDLNSERAALQKMESSKNTLEKQARKFYDENSVWNTLIKIKAGNYFLSITSIIQEFPRFSLHFGAKFSRL